MDLDLPGEFMPPVQGPFEANSFRLGRRVATVSTDDAIFRERFLRLFFDCCEPQEEAPREPRVVLKVSSARSSNSVFAEISEHDDEFDPVVLEMLFPEAKLGRGEGAAPDGWQLYTRRDEPSEPVVAARRGSIVLSKKLPWQVLAGHYFVHHVMRLQPDILFLHGGSLVINGGAIFLGGAKGAGKSTLSLALAARGHGFLGDEIAAVHGETRMCLPFRRAVSVRVGPQAGAVDAFLSDRELEREALPDGSTRTRVLISQIFPDAPSQPAPLANAVFLSGFSDHPKVERFDFSRGDLHLLGPLYAMFAGRPIGKRALDLLNLFGSVRCHKVIAGGSPDRTADLIEQIVEGQWA